MTKYTITLTFNAKSLEQGADKFISFCRNEDIEILEDTFYFQNEE